MLIQERFIKFIDVSADKTANGIFDKVSHLLMSFLYKISFLDNAMMGPG